MSRFGHNLGYVDELHRRYLEDPESVSEAWREFFEDYPGSPAAPAEAKTSTVAAPPAVPSAEAAAPPGEGEQPLRGAAARIVENMITSLSVPTATSMRSIPVKLLEENRRVLNQHQSTIAGPKISYTHLIAWAIVRALARHPRMNVRYVEREGKPFRVDLTSIHLGLAIDVERRGERVLLVPCVRSAEQLSFPAFVAAYDDLVARARKNELAVEDFDQTSVTLTNPGMLGTVASVPRLMQGQGAILGVGAIGYPAEYSGVAPAMISALGISKVMTITSTYDHRVIQGAESGEFLAHVGRLLQGHEGLYDRIFAELGVPREPIEWSGDRNPQAIGSSGNLDAIVKQAGVLQLIRAFRVRGHLWADLDPLRYEPQPTPELELSTYGLSVWDLDREFIAGGLGGHDGTLQLREITDTLQQTYCRHVGVEYMHIPDTPSRHWIQQRIEHPDNRTPYSREEQLHILERLIEAEAFETFLHSSYVGQKRFSLEGAETLIPMLDTLLRDGSGAGIEEVLIGMAHRGRLNVAAHIVGKPYGRIFGEFEDIDPQSAHGSGDVKYHLGASGEFDAGDGRTLRVAISANPSHLEAVDPVVEGRARARQDRTGDSERRCILPVLIHGDAAFAGQGVVAETLHLSQLKGYRTGGTVHIVVNNQIGFTTGPADARSSQYPTDVAKMVHAPIFHVNGDYPEAAVRVIRHALAFRQRFQRDVVVDLVCYRRWGHNEADDPSYTHPLLYARIEQHRSVRKLYTEQLLRRGDLDPETAESTLERFRTRLQQVRDEVRGAQQQRSMKSREPRGPEPAGDETPVAPPPAAITAVDRPALITVVEALGRTPDDFATHPKLVRQLAQRRKRFDSDRIDFALAEALAFGTLVRSGRPVRLSGEDSGRGTFSQRHAVLYDHRTGEPWVPLSHIAEDQAPFNVYDSLLSEFAVLGFEYGYSLDHPDTLVLWEAQFGDFSNGAQVIIDQFIVCAAEKWNHASGVVLLLPHGSEGQGPEHSSARLERFLQLCAERNIQVANPSTPAQYFHLLRGQALAETRRPLVVMTPKSLLRHPACVSPVERFTDGAFETVLASTLPRSAPVRQLLLCSGKVYYDLEQHATRNDIDGAAIVRVERLYPFPAERLARICAEHAETTDVVWVQEEPRNMGAWSFIGDRLRSVLRPGQQLRYLGRPAAASPATGSHKRHLAEQEDLVRRAFESAERRASTPAGS